MLVSGRPGLGTRDRACIVKLIVGDTTGVEAHKMEEEDSNV
ncbi:hypothetical protein [Desulfosporosinus hippei]|nr:hypothetical protein [Desulfosporosinus hippei]